MILQVTKENEHFPVGAEFLYNEDIEEYIYNERTEDIGDDVYQTTDRYYRFSPSFYDDNKEIFTEIKIEETNEKNKNKFVKMAVLH